MPPVLRLCEDVLSDGAALSLPALPRLAFVVHGSIAAGDRVLARRRGLERRRCSVVQSGRRGRDRVALGAGGSRDRRRRPRHRHRHRLARKACSAPRHPAARAAAPSRRQRRLPAGRLRLSASASGAGHPLPDRRRHPHRHHGRSTSYGPGGAWYENGPEPVFAQAAADRPTRFIRVMVLPAACLGKSSLEYLNAEDKAKPKTQQYKVFADMPLRPDTGR